MAPESKAPELYEEVKRLAFENFGWKGLLVLAGLAAVFWVWKEWDKVKTLPGIAPLLARWRRWPVPTVVDHSRYTILVAHLENDVNREHEDLLMEALKEYEGADVLPLDRTITLKGPVPREMEKRGQEEARRYLKESGASVLIWGKVLSHSKKNITVYKLYWTPASGGARKPERYDTPTEEAQLRLPEVFWGDLAEILRLQVISGAAEFDAQEGRYVADRLPPFIARVKRLLEDSGGRPGWDADARGTTLVILADALYTLGEQSGQNKPLEEAVASYKAALKEHTRERVPLDWAMTQNRLGMALRSLGKREKSTKHLEEAVAAYRKALMVRTRELVPWKWAMTQNNLGNALTSLGEREKIT
jgi:tetratricopeptide (TPR) repeat protein